ncbi:MAG: hypothetical protein RIS36_74 [Pseudomonadota bacterium]
MKRSPKIVLLLVSIVSISSTAFAFDEAIVAQFSRQVSDLVCSDGGAWVACYGEDPSNCKSIADSLIGPCATQVFLPIKEQLSYDQGVQAAQRLMGCFNERFEQSYGSRKLSTPECKEPAKHLRGS